MVGFSGIGDTGPYASMNASLSSEHGRVPHSPEYKQHPDSITAHSGLLWMLVFDIHSSGNEKEHIIITVTPLGFQAVPLGGRNDCDSISPAVVQTGQTTGGTDTQQDSPSRHGSAGRGHCPLLSISPVSPLLLVHGSGQPVRACQHFLDEGIPRAWADRCPNPGLLCTGCRSHHRGRCSMCGGGTTVPPSYAVALQHFRWWLPPDK